MSTRDDASRHLWNPMCRLPDILDRQRVLVRGEGSTVYDEDGRGYIDAQGSLWYASVGYGREEIVRATAEQMRNLHAYGLFGDIVTPPAADLATRLASLTPGDLNRVFFTSGGSEAVESAIKIVRQYFRLRGRADRFKVISRWSGYHGVTLGALSATGTTRNRAQVEPLVPGFPHIDPLSAEALEEAILREDPATVAAFIAEPIMGAGGVLIPPPDYFSRVREICDRYGILFIADEVICGFGRLGHWFGIEHWDVTPDLVVMAKGISSGYTPLGAVAVSERVCEPFVDPDRQDNGFFHGNTYAGHAASCAAALANLKIIEDEGLLEKSRADGIYLAELLDEMSAGQEAVREVRAGIGLIAAVDLALPPGGAPAKELSRRAYEQGVLVRPMTATAVTLSPPLVITRGELEQVAATLGTAISEMGAQLPAGTAS
jgi:putrescine aminotransferase